MQIETLVRCIKKNKPKADLKLVRKAYRFAEKHHKGQKRESGEPFIEHPLQVAKILAEHSLDIQTIVAGLLHDTVEDTKASIETIKKEFGAEVANLVDGVTKIKELHVTNWEERHAESIRKMIMASAQDIRVIFIKLADKLHNMRTVKACREDKRKRVAQEVMDVYAPIAYKLGMAGIKSELEDLAFEQLNPEAYKNIITKLKKTIAQREKEMAEFRNVLEPELEKNGIKPLKIFGRAKHAYSIYRKMQKYNYGIEGVYDLIALRIITNTVKECYEVVGIIHQLWKPMPGRFKDFIAMPKPNMYQSLHTTVIAKGQPVEIQVRTKDMDKIAEEGIAAHWHYKGVYGDKEFDAKLSWLRQILDWQRELRDSKEFMEMLHFDFFEKEIYTFTPRGDVISLPRGATVLDFAYAVHSNVGDTCIGARVNGKFVPVRTELSNGNLVEIITSKAQKPSRDWLKFVVTSKAKTKIKQRIRELGKIPVKSYRAKETGKSHEEWIIKVDGVRDPEIHIARCCNPLPGEPIVGFASNAGKVSIHKAGCFNIKKLEVGLRKKQVNVGWIDTDGATVEVKVDAVDRVGLFAEILNSVVATNTQIKAASARTISSGMVECSFSIEPKSLAHLGDILRRIRRIKDVKKVYIGGMKKS